MVKTIVRAGVCGFITEIEANSKDSQNVFFKVKTDCDKILNLSKKLTTFDAYNEIKDGFEGELFKVIRNELTGCCAGCAVPVGLFKSMQAAANVALPKDIEISMSK